MINRFVNLLSSMKFATSLILIMAFSIGYATFIENDFGSSTSKALIYNAWWFELILILLTITLTINIFKQNLFRKEKLATLMFHLSFIIIMIGAGVTRYTGYEGMMRIKEGDKSNTFLSDDAYLQIKVNDGIQQYKYDKKLHLSGITKRYDKTPILNQLFSNYFTISNSDLEEEFSITYLDFLPNVSDSVIKKNIKGITLSSSGNSNKEGTDLSVNDFINKDILIGSETIFKDVNFTFNNKKDNSVNFYFDNNILKCVSEYDVSITSMPPDGNPPNIYKSGEEFELNKMSLLTIKTNKYMFSDFSYEKESILYSTSNNMDNTSKNENRLKDALLLKVKSGNISKKITLEGRKGMYPNSSKFSLGKLNFELSYGPKFFETPFNVYLHDFQLEKYPGSNSPASFASEVEVIDGIDSIPYRIFMNNVLDYDGHRFFQSSYDPDESGTILSVNHDWWGTIISYIGYFFLMLGMILVFFQKQTRFQVLTKNLNKIKKVSSILILILFSIKSYSIESPSDLLKDNIIDIKHSDKLESLLVQHDGRIKPFSTLSSELIRKISRKETIYNLNSTQILMGAISYPQLWRKIPLVKVQNSQLLEELGSKEDMLSFDDFFNDNKEYILKEKIKKSSNIPDVNKSKYDKELIKVDERLSILFSVINTGTYNYFLNIFPSTDTNNTKWEGILNAPRMIGDSISNVNVLNLYTQTLMVSTISKDWSWCDTLLNTIKDYQNEHGKDLIQSKFKINLELLYNKIDVFSLLFKWYFFTGLLMLILCIISIFKNQSKFLLHSIKFLKYIILVGWGLHTLGLISRWIISNHAPWTNGYEAMIYTVWATMLAGIIFSKKSNLTLATTTCVSSLLLLFAFVSYLDPTITNVVPVLNSYWLMIHVSIIVASYGFLILGGFLGLLALTLMIFTNSNNKKIFNLRISELTIINERSITVGVYMLTIGTFLGGIWANESWGRYWGWDPKETWALVSILVYAFILHMRFIPALKSKWTFNTMSAFAVYSVLMTYFGVNYLLSGLHSYAAGDKVEIPMAVWISVGIVLTIVVLARIRNKKYKI